MDQLTDFADERLLNGCTYCFGPVETRDHVPSRILLDDPFPTNLPVVPCCDSCNRGFSLDEEYMACLIEATIAGSTAPENLRREKIRRILRRRPKLRSLIESAKSTQGDEVQFDVDVDRIRNVVLKLARGHAAFELSVPVRQEPTVAGWIPIHLMNPGDRERFDEPYVSTLYGEVGSRSFQRTMVASVSIPGAEEGDKPFEVLVNDWVEVQPGRYRYLAAEQPDGVSVRIVIGEYLACWASWSR